MNELELLQNIYDEIHCMREIVYCCGIFVVFGIAYLSGR